jgi:ribonuclease Y
LTYELEPFQPALAAATDWPVVAVSLAVIAGAAGGWAFVWWFNRHLRERAREDAGHIVELGRREAEVARQTRLSEAGIEIERRRAELDREITRRELEIDAKLREIRSHEESLGNLDHEMAQREEKLGREQAAIRQARESVRAMSRSLRQTMENLASMNVEEVRANLRDQVRQECQDELRTLRREFLERSETEIIDESRRMLVAAMQRLTSKPNNDLTATIVQLPNDDMKGRIIGREGRNIKCFEAATGTTLLIDESPQMVLISSFDPIRREIARTALERLIADGRIHPATIEDFVGQARAELDVIVQKAGDAAVAQLNLSAVHPEVITLLGKLKFRFSYTQNVLDHSIEVAQLCSMLASELRLDPVVAKRAGLFHDIGKSVDGEYEGSHARIGGEFLKRRGEDPIVVNAVAAHHEEIKAESAYAGLVMLADTISAIRPGARAESLASYIERLDRLEKLATTMEGVQSAFAIQAGREIRVIVRPDMVDDQQASKLARDLRRKIEDELQYPSTIKVTVIRERRFTETAT